MHSNRVESVKAWQINPQMTEANWLLKWLVDNMRGMLGDPSRDKKSSNVGDSGTYFSKTH